MYINEVTITLEISSEFKETLEASPTTPKAVLYLNVFRERQQDQAAKHFLKNLYNPSYQMASEDIEEINGKYYVTKTFSFVPSPHPVVSLAFETNEAKPGYTPTINNMTIEVNKLWGERLAAEIDLEIDNISW